MNADIELAASCVLENDEELYRHIHFPWEDAYSKSESKKRYLLRPPKNSRSISVDSSRIDTLDKIQTCEESYNRFISISQNGSKNVHKIVFVGQVNHLTSNCLIQRAPCVTILPVDTIVNIFHCNLEIPENEISEMTKKFKFQKI